MEQKFGSVTHKTVIKTTVFTEKKTKKKHEKHKKRIQRNWRYTGKLSTNFTTQKAYFIFEYLFNVCLCRHEFIV